MQITFCTVDRIIYNKYAFLWVIGFWVEDGCASDTWGVHDGSFQDKSYEAGVRCCSNDGTTCSSPLTCYRNGIAVTTSFLSYEDAVSKCSEDNRRLCSKDELISGICCGTGGGCDGFEIWTSTSDSG